MGVPKGASTCYNLPQQAKADKVWSNLPRTSRANESQAKPAGLMAKHAGHVGACPLVAMRSLPSSAMSCRLARVACGSCA